MVNSVTIAAQRAERPKARVYNDDVQGRAGITLAGMINAVKITGTKLKDEKYLFLPVRFGVPMFIKMFIKTRPPALSTDL